MGTMNVGKVSFGNSQPAAGTAQGAKNAAPVKKADKGDVVVIGGKEIKKSTIAKGGVIATAVAALGTLALAASRGKGLNEAKAAIEKANGGAEGEATKFIQNVKDGFKTFFGEGKKTYKATLEQAKGLGEKATDAAAVAADNKAKDVAKDAAKDAAKIQPEAKAPDAPAKQEPVAAKQEPVAAKQEPAPAKEEPQTKTPKEPSKKGNVTTEMVESQNKKLSGIEKEIKKAEAEKDRLSGKGKDTTKVEAKIKQLEAEKNEALNRLYDFRAAQELSGDKTYAKLGQKRTQAKEAFEKANNRKETLEKEIKEAEDTINKYNKWLSNNNKKKINKHGGKKQINTELADLNKAKAKKEAEVKDIVNGTINGKAKKGLKPFATLQTEYNEASTKFKDYKKSVKSVYAAQVDKELSEKALADFEKSIEGKVVRSQAEVDKLNKLKAAKNSKTNTFDTVRRNVEQHIANLLK